VHALLDILLEAGNLNLQAQTPVQQVSERDAEGWITVTTDRGSIRAKAVIHSTNAFASHLLPEFNKLIMPERCSLAAVPAPAGFIKHTGAQHWDATVNVGDYLTDGRWRFSNKYEQNYHLQLPEPYNDIILGGGRQLLVHKADECFPSDEDNDLFEGMGDFFASWGARDVKDWPGSRELSRAVDDGGCWTGSMSKSITRGGACKR
jgi:glycine/D-amino acid oxidase-like deaminating enzyme